MKSFHIELAEVIRKTNLTESPDHLSTDETNDGWPMPQVHYRSSYVSHFEEEKLIFQSVFALISWLCCFCWRSRLRLTNLIDWLTQQFSSIERWFTGQQSCHIFLRASRLTRMLLSSVCRRAKSIWSQNFSLIFLCHLTISQSDLRRRFSSR